MLFHNLYSTAFIVNSSGTFTEVLPIDLTARFIYKMLIYVLELTQRTYVIEATGGFFGCVGGWPCTSKYEQKASFD